MTGWVCPTCQHVYAPHLAECPRCPPTTYTVVTGITPGCTCGTSVRCARHQPAIPPVTSASPRWSA